ncbi:GtrA family protein [Candidatus Methanarcanum hacksteinii]|uniref:GtrA family protein n=1 Tax=Candidatus Methanarcanum hacksteinii TaxID=2911857 RepID=UPI0037DC450F
MGKISDLMTKYREAIAYVFFGGLTTIVGWVAYALFVNIGIELNLTNILSCVCGVTFAFVVNKWFVFQSKSVEKKTVLRELGSFFGSRIFTGVIAWVLFPILLWAGIDQTFFGTEGFIAKVITSIIEIILNWVLSKYFVFKKERSE